MLGSGERRKRALGVGVMALSLVIAAAIGAGAGLVWQSAGLGEEAQDNRPEDAGEQSGAQPN